MADKRITVRFNDKELAQLELLKRNFHIEKESEALKLAIDWVNSYIHNVTKTFFPSTHEVVLVKKIKQNSIGRKVWE